MANTAKQIQGDRNAVQRTVKTDQSTNKVDIGSTNIGGGGRGGRNENEIRGDERGGGRNQRSAV